MKIVFAEMSQLAELIRRERKRQGVTQIQLARLSNVGVRFVRDLEDGKRSVHLDKVMSVLETLGIMVEMTTIDEEE